MKGSTAKFYILFTYRHKREFRNQPNILISQKKKKAQTRQKANAKSRIWTQIFWISEHIMFHLIVSHWEERNTILPNQCLMTHLNLTYTCFLFCTIDCNHETLVMCRQFVAYGLQRISTYIIWCESHNYPGILVSANLKAEVRWARGVWMHQMWLSRNSLSL